MIGSNPVNNIVIGHRVKFEVSTTDGKEDNQLTAFQKSCLWLMTEIFSDDIGNSVVLKEKCWRFLSDGIAFY